MTVSESVLVFQAKQKREFELSSTIIFGPSLMGLFRDTIGIRVSYKITFKLRENLIIRSVNTISKICF